MRKFPNVRVYDKGQDFQNKSKMVYLKGVEEFDDSILFRFERHLEDYEDLKHMWGTGLFDDTGKEIYDNDIVKVHDTTETKIPYVTQVYLSPLGSLVEPHPAHRALGISSYRKLEDYCDYGVGGQYHLSCKIIGNIYENPELLKQ